MEHSEFDLVNNARAEDEGIFDNYYKQSEMMTREVEDDGKEGSPQEEGQEYGNEEEQPMDQEQFEGVDEETDTTDVPLAQAQPNQEEELKKKIVLYYHQLVSRRYQLMLVTVPRSTLSVVRADAAEELSTFDQGTVHRPKRPNLEKLDP